MWHCWTSTAPFQSKSLFSYRRQDQPPLIILKIPFMLLAWFNLELWPRPCFLSGDNFSTTLQSRSPQVRKAVSGDLSQASLCCKDRTHSARQDTNASCWQPACQLAAQHKEQRAGWQREYLASTKVLYYSFPSYNADCKAVGGILTKHTLWKNIAYELTYAGTATFKK